MVRSPVSELADQLDLVGGGDRLGFILQPVARADLDDADEIIHGPVLRERSDGRPAGGGAG